MSSRLLPPDDARPIVPITWRSVETAGGRSSLHLGASGGDVETGRFEQQIRDAHAAGMREGEAAGHNRAAAELQPVVERLARSIDELATLRPKLRREAEGDLIRLSLAIARRILNRELAVDPDALHGLVLGALERLQGQEIVRVRVHAAHAALLTACLGPPAKASSIQVVAEPGCELGTVVFETERGSLDASVATQLHEIERGLADRLRSAR